MAIAGTIYQHLAAIQARECGRLVLLAGCTGHLNYELSSAWLIIRESLDYAAKVLRAPGELLLDAIELRTEVFEREIPIVANGVGNVQCGQTPRTLVASW